MTAPIDLATQLEAQGFTRFANGGGTHVMRKDDIVISGADGDLPDWHWYTVARYTDWEGDPETEALISYTDWSAEFPDMNEPREFWTDLAMVQRWRAGITVTELLAMPVTSRPEAEAFIEALHHAGLSHHFDDGAVNCLVWNDMVSTADAVAIEAQVSRCYVAWRDSGADMANDCPIGHALKVMGS